MDDLIEALTIFRKYGNPKYPTNCVHDGLYIMEYHIEDISSEDVDRLETLGFIWDDIEGVFMSYKFGSA
jgi:hypothetical protein